MNCLNCGTPLRDSARFCPGCGAAAPSPKDINLSKVETLPDARALQTHQRWEYHWEYMVRTHEPSGTGEWDNNITDKLAMLGDQGWELVAIAPRSGLNSEHYAGVTTEELWIFKRPKQ
jgi:hypothetical protein